MNRPQPNEYAPYQEVYIQTVPDDVIDELESQAAAFPTFLRSFPEEKGDYAYAPGKWTLKQMLGHLIDNERIMAYRLLCLSRNDKAHLPGYEQDDYIAYSTYNDQNFAKLIDEFEVLRRANLFLFRSLTDEQLQRRGAVSNYEITVKAILFIIAGHVNHHRKIITERYL